MKIVGFGSRYEVYPDDLKTYDEIPVGTYEIKFHPMAGFWLEKITDFVQVEEKIYGKHEQRVAKIIKASNMMERSLGVIFSGKKGIGKSLSTQLLAVEYLKQEKPVIIARKAYKGITDFIEKIEQDCLILIDEFEKMFPKQRGDKENQYESQEEMLSLFDGLSQQKRLYVVTVNKLTDVNEYLLNRPGRFHYHIDFGYPNSEEIHEYLSDKLAPEHHKEIKHVIAFSSRASLNYDSLRAIAFELNLGQTFAEAIGDLNILSTDSEKYTVAVELSSGEVQIIKPRSLNLFDSEARVDSRTNQGFYFEIEFNPLDLLVDAATDALYLEDVSKAKIKLYLDGDEDNDEVKALKDLKVKTLVVEKVKPKTSSYNASAYAYA